jgi:type VI secretion system secreted protein VgrG
LPQFSDDNRTLKLTTPLGKDALLVLGFRGVEKVSGLFEYTLELVGERSTPADFSKVVGANATLEIQGPADGKAPGKRKIEGMVTRFSSSGAVSSVQTAPGQMIDYLHYTMVLSPALWNLTRASDNRIFQDKTGKQIVESVLQGRGVTKFALSVASSLSRPYCVQFAETDFAFVSRLLEDEGIYYWFDQGDSGHELKISDTKGGGPVCGPAAGIEFRPAGAGTDQATVITTWREVREVTTAKVALQAYNFETPATNLTASIDTTVSVGKNAKLERYEYSDDYGTLSDGNSRAKFRIEEAEAGHQRFDGESNCAFLIAGRTFKLKNHVQADQNTDYMLLEVQHEARNNNYAMFLDGDDTGYYVNRFEAIRKTVQYRPPLVTPRPRVYGVQSAVVVGPSSEEIYTDKYGRIKVQFHWDRLGKKDESSSCWMRVAQAWASNTWGAQFIPRVGQEVLVDFIDGDLDRPLVTGALYNAQKMPPYALPDNKTQSGVKTRSTAQGTAENFNELRFEDKKGSEDINFQAEKDFHRLVKNDDFLDVQHDQTIKVKNNRTENVLEGNEKVTVDKGNREVEIAKGNESLKVGEGNRLVTVSKGDDTHKVETGKRVVEVQANDELTVKQGDRVIKVQQGKDETTVGMGDSKLTVSQGNREVTVSVGNDKLTVSTGNHQVAVSLGKSTTEATGGIELKVGANSIKIDQSGVTIKGMTVKVEGSIQTQIKGAITQVNGDGMVQVQGGVIMLG